MYICMYTYVCMAVCMYVCKSILDTSVCYPDLESAAVHDVESVSLVALSDHQLALRH